MPPPEFVSLAGSPWAGWALGTDGLRHLYCEANRLDAWLRQPVNTISSATLLVAALVILRRARRDSGHRAVPSAALGWLLVGAAAGSAAFHASLTYVAQSVDMAFAYTCVLALAGPSLQRLMPGANGGGSERVYVVALAALTLGLVRWPVLGASFVLMPSLLSMVALLAYADHKRHRALSPPSTLKGAALMTLAVAAWFADRAHLACEPHLFPWGHAAWHALTAWAFVYLHDGLFRTSPPREDQAERPGAARPRLPEPSQR